MKKIFTDIARDSFEHWFCIVALTAAELIEDKDFDPSQPVEYKLTVNGVEVDLQPILDRVEGYLADKEKEIDEQAVKLVEDNLGLIIDRVAEEFKNSLRV